MLIGVFSDVHDNIDNLRKSQGLYADRQVETLAFCGDFCSPIPSRVMGECGLTIHCVFGNGDGDRFTIHKLASSQFPNLKLHGEHAELELGGQMIALTHYPLYGDALARTGDYGAVFSGHTHELRQEQRGDCVWLNPGEVLGGKGRGSCAIYDTDTSEVEIQYL